MEIGPAFSSQHFLHTSTAWLGKAEQWLLDKLSRIIVTLESNFFIVSTLSLLPNHSTGVDSLPMITVVGLNVGRCTP
jgi:hypothetical protein